MVVGGGGVLCLVLICLRSWFGGVPKMLTYMRRPLVPARAIDGEVVDVDVAGLDGGVDLLLRHVLLSFPLDFPSRLKLVD